MVLATDEHQRHRDGTLIKRDGFTKERPSAIGKVVASVVFLLLFALPALAADIDLFRSDTSGIQPNVLVLLDTSESMNENTISGGPYDPLVTYAGSYDQNVVYCKEGNAWDNVFRNSTTEVSCPEARTALEAEGFFAGKIDRSTAECGGNKNYYLRTGNYLNYLSSAESGTQPRFGLATGTLQSYLNTTYGVRFGVMVFNDANEKDEGGMLLRQVRDMTPQSRSDLHSAIGSLKAETWSPMAEALFEAGFYYRGEPSFFNPGVTYTSPIQYWCQKNYIIVISDGLSTRDRSDVLRTLGSDGDTDGDGSDPGVFTDDDPSDDDVTDRDATEGSTYLDDVAKYLYDADLRSDLEDKQNLVTYTIGFTPNSALLEDTAENGRGRYFYAHNAQSIAVAFQAIIEEILSQTTSYAAPTVPVGQMENTTSGGRIYLAVFKPSGSAFWKGNIKKLALAHQANDALGISKGDVIDANGNLATDDDGYIVDTAVSFWGDGSADGPETEAGGVGEVLLDRTTSRNLYTYLGVSPDLTSSSNAFTRANSTMTPDILGLNDKDTEGRNRVIDFVHGYDAYDEDGDLNTVEKRTWILGAFLHSRPAVVHYDPSTSVIFAGANDGMVHAFLDSDGSELWGFIPPDLLDRLRLLGGDILEYFVDGAPAAAVFDHDNDGNIESADGDQVIVVFGERRGGRDYYALDVTDPYRPQLLWRVSPEVAGFSEMGQSWGTPVFGRTAYGDQPVVFFSGGYDPRQDSDSNRDTMGRGVYVVELLTGNLIKEFTVDTNPDMTWSIPSDIAVVDTTDSGFIDRAYVGDMGGRLWRFDLTSPHPMDWSSEILFRSNYPVDGGRKIFYPPDVLLEPGYEQIVFGTGDRANPNKDTVVNRFYAVKDRHTGQTLDESSLADVTDDLLQDLSASEATKADLRNILETGSGWYIRLLDNPGEKVLAPPVTFFGTVYVTTHTPTQEALADPCSAQQGTGRLYALNYKTGEASRDFDPTNNAVGSEVLEQSDRERIIGGSIPSMMVVAMIGGEASGLIGVGGGLFGTELLGYSPLLRIYWRHVY